MSFENISAEAILFFILYGITGVVSLITRKSLVNTFVTTFGVADGIHRSIVDSEVSMEDLFEP